MKLIRRTVLALIAWAFTAPALADHPGEDLDARMTEKEKYFQAIDEPAQDFALANAKGHPIRLSDFADKVVVLNFIYANCPDVCPLHAQKIAEIQGMINDSAMKDMVQFISVTTDPKNDTPDILLEYSGWHGLDPANWIFLTTQADQPEDATRALAREYGLEFTMSADSEAQMHGVVTHVIDRGGRLAAKSHGMEFENVNAVLYINGLLNNAQHADRERGWFDSVRDLFN